MHPTNDGVTAPLDARTWRDAYLPRGRQRPFLYAFEMELYRVYVLEWHRRYGKSRVLLNAGWRKVMNRKWPIWHGFPEFAQGRDVFWNAVDAHTGRRLLDDVLPYTSRVNDQRMILWFGDIFYQVMGFDRYNARVGAGPKIIFYDEWSLMDPMARNYFRPMIMENQGIEVFAFTPRGDNHAAGLVDTAKAYPQEYYLSQLSIADTIRDAPTDLRYGEPVVSEEDVEHERRLFKTSNGKMGMSNEMIDQEFHLSHEGVNEGKVFGKELRDARQAGRITAVPYTPGKLVHTAWDRGVHNRIWFWQDFTTARHYIDFLRTDNSDLPEIIRMMREMGPEGQPRHRYSYGDHWVGRDAEDPAVWSLHSGFHMAESMGLRFRIAPNLRKLTQIDRGKARISTSYFDAKFCGDGLDDLREYAWAKDATYGTLKEPNKNQPSRHGADAYMISAIAGEPEQKAESTHQLPPAPGHWQGV